MSCPGICRRGKRDDGFTLLELLLAITLTGLLSVGLFAGLQSGTRVWELTDARSRVLSDDAVSENVLRRHITRAAPVLISRPGRSRALFFEGSRSRIRFFTEAEAGLQPAGHYGEEIELRRAAGGTEMIIRRGRQRLDAVRQGSDIAGGVEWDQSVLRLPAGHAEFRFFGHADGLEKSVWQTDWRGRSALPGLIRLAFANGEGSTRVIDSSVDESANDITIAPKIGWTALQANQDLIDEYFAGAEGY